jgi:ribosomal protein S18 acetylase RimI-like enzyme
MNKSAINEGTQSSMLEPMNLHNTTEFNELLRQRVVCGWDFSLSSLESWRSAATAQTLSMFWIVSPSLSQLPAPQRYSGHIMAQRKIEPLHNELSQHIFNLFILPEHRCGGLGRAAVQALEEAAKVEPYGSPSCKAISLNALSRRYIEDDGEEWRGMYTRLCASLGIEVPAKGSGTEDWYTRMGFVKYEEKPMYPVELDGNKFLLNAALLRKDLA